MVKKIIFIMVFAAVLAGCGKDPMTPEAMSEKVEYCKTLGLGYQALYQGLEMDIIDIRCVPK